MARPRAIRAAGYPESIEEIAQRESVTGSYHTAAPSRLPAPDITAAFLHGRHSPELIAAMLRHSCLGLDDAR